MVLGVHAGIITNLAAVADAAAACRGRVSMVCLSVSELRNNNNNMSTREDAKHNRLPLPGFHVGATAWWSCGRPRRRCPCRRSARACRRIRPRSPVRSQDRPCCCSCWPTHETCLCCLPSLQHALLMRERCKTENITRFSVRS